MPGTAGKLYLHGGRMSRGILDQVGLAGPGAGLQHAAGGAAFVLGQALWHGAAVGEYPA